MNKKNSIIIISAIVILLLMTTPAISSGLYSLLKKLEEDNNVQLIAYDDGTGTWTIGYGSIYNYDLKRKVQQGDRITQEQADRYLKTEADQNLAQVGRYVSRPLTAGQIIALASFIYNEGIGAFTSSTLLKKLNNGSPLIEVAQEFDKWVWGKVNGEYKKLPGLVARRNAEKNLFLNS